MGEDIKISFEKSSHNCIEVIKVKFDFDWHVMEHVID